jgi:hypothetical protein
VADPEAERSAFVMQFDISLGGTRIPAEHKTSVAQQYAVENGFHVIRANGQNTTLVPLYNETEFSEPPFTPFPEARSDLFFPNHTRMSLTTEGSPVTFEAGPRHIYTAEIRPQVDPEVTKAIVSTLNSFVGKIEVENQARLLDHLRVHFGVTADSLSACFEVLSQKYPITTVLNALIPLDEDRVPVEDWFGDEVVEILDQFPRLAMNSTVSRGQLMLRLNEGEEEMPEWIGEMTHMTNEASARAEAAEAPDINTAAQEDPNEDKLVLTGSEWVDNTTNGKFRAWISDDESGVHYYFETHTGTLLVPQTGKLMARQIPLIAGMRIRMSQAVLAEAGQDRPFVISDVCDSLDDHINDIIRQKKDGTVSGMRATDFRDAFCLYLTYSEEVERVENPLRVTT